LGTKLSINKTQEQASRISEFSLISLHVWSTRFQHRRPHWCHWLYLYT